MICRDCGEEIEKNSTRSDVCHSCFEKRGKILTLLKEGEIEGDQFLYIQQCMQQGNGIAVFFMNDVLGIENNLNNKEKGFNSFEIAWKSAIVKKKLNRQL